MGARRALPRVMSASWVVMTYRYIGKPSDLPPTQSSEVSSTFQKTLACARALTLASNPISPPCYSQESPIIELFTHLSRLPV